MNIELSKEELEMVYEALSYHTNIPIACDIINKLQSTVNSSALNEELQLQDKVVYDKQTGYINGQIDGKWIVQVQGNTYMVDPKDLKEYSKKPEVVTKPHMKFDEETQKLLFEQYVKCGVYHGNVPIKMNDCYVKYNQWEAASPEQQVKVLIEGTPTFMSKSQIKLLEDLNDFANEADYVPGVIIDEANEEAIENILVNAIDYTNSVGDADSIRIIKLGSTGQQELQTAPKSIVRTLTV